MHRLDLLRDELDAILSSDPASVRVAERDEFDRLSGGREIVLMGAGGLGRRTLAGLRRHNVEPLAFADNAPARQGTLVDGLSVLSPDVAARQFAHRAVFVVTIWGANSPHRFAHSREQLQLLGCDAVCSFPSLFWKYSDGLLPFYLQDFPSRVLEQREDVRRTFELWQDDASRTEYVAQVRFRVRADFDGLSHPVGHPQYFPDDLFTWVDDERVVDGGAYDGDTIRTISKLYGDRFGHILAIEPDPANFLELRALVAALPQSMRERIHCHQTALASAPGTLHLDATGTAASTTGVASAPGTVTVKADTLDSFTHGRPPSFIKLDIEGAEIDALEGARATIQRHAPVLAVCVYHRQDHIWRVPWLLHQWRDDYAFFLRPHNEEGWDLVCYAIPRHRLAGRRP